MLFVVAASLVVLASIAVVALIVYVRTLAPVLTIAGGREPTPAGMPEHPDDAGVWMTLLGNEGRAAVRLSKVVYDLSFDDRSRPQIKAGTVAEVNAALAAAGYDRGPDYQLLGFGPGAMLGRIGKRSWRC